MGSGRKRKDLSLLEGDSARPFLEAVDSKVTIEVYKRRLATFLEFVGLNVDEFTSKSRKNPKWSEQTITKYLLTQKERVTRKEISASTVSSLKKPIKLLLDMNDITRINWKKIGRMLPRVRRFALDRAPTIEELRALISNSDLRFQSVIQVMVSSGIRVGAWDYLNWGDVQPIEKNETLLGAKLTVYRADPEQYISFISPEAYSSLIGYIELRGSHGEKITKNSPLIRDKWQANLKGSHKGDIKEPKRLASSGVKRLFEDTAWKIGIRKEKKKRHEFSIHSIRKFFKTRTEQVMKPINVETLMGHSTGISDSYYRPTEKELLQDYLKAIPLLTISEIEEVRRDSQLSRKELEGRLGQLEDLVSKLIAEKGQTNPSPGHSHNSGTSSSHTKRVVSTEDLTQFLDAGWDPIMNLPDGKIIIQL